MRISSRAIVINGEDFLVMDRNKFGTKYLTLIGGGLDPNEDPVDAVIREVKEETTLSVNNPRLVIIEDAGNVFGLHYIFLCDYRGGEVKLSPDSEEYKISQLGQNIYTPKWIKISELEESNFLPKELKYHILEFIKNGYPEKPIKITARD